ncbi:MAG TPA: cupin domain-containing protein [Candidatus Saccharimonadales bacterium]|nr:cupin domain-containing protein [Candidatus Saccharimonadales bacterium]
MKGYIHDIKDQAIENTFFRKVLESGKHTQIVLMSLPEGEEIGMETHDDNDQVLYIVQGSGKAILNGEEKAFKKDDIFLVQAGTEHNFVNTGEEDLKIITAYSPAHHPEGTIHETKADAQNAQY